MPLRIRAGSFFGLVKFYFIVSFSTEAGLKAYSPSFSRNVCSRLFLVIQSFKNRNAIFSGGISNNPESVKPVYLVSVVVVVVSLLLPDDPRLRIFWFSISTSWATFDASVP